MPLVHTTVPDVTVVIPTYNRRVFTREAVASVLSQSGVTVEVVVADDGSTDGTREALRNAHGDEAVIVHECQHAGAQTARNAGLDRATGRYLKFLDSDDVMSPNSLSDHVAAADRAGAAVSYGDFEFFGDLSLQEVGSQPTRRMGEPTDIVVALLESWWLPTGGYLINREQLGHIRWDESFARNQDMDYALSLALTGQAFHHYEHVVVRKRAHRQGRIMDASAYVYGIHCEKVADKTFAALRNAGELTKARSQAIADLYWHASRYIYGSDKEAYSRLVGKIHELFPRYVPSCRTYAGPKMSWAVRLLGIQNGERLMRALGR